MAFPSARAQDGPPPEVRQAIGALEGMLEASSDSALRVFITTRLSPEYRATMSDAAILAHLRRLQAAFGSPIGGVMVERTPAGLALLLSGAQEAVILFTRDDAYRVGSLSLGDPGTRPGAAERSAARAHWAELSWDNLTSHFQGAAERGFFMFHVTDGRGSAVLALSASDQMPETRAMLDAVERLLRSR